MSFLSIYFSYYNSNYYYHVVAITKDENAKMHWANYFRNVVQRYKVVIEGWPANIPFVNLSQASSALPDLEMIRRKWESRAICWREIDDEEFQQLLEERNEKLESGEITDHRRRTRSDKGKKRARSTDGSGRRKKTYKSTETVETDNEDETTPAANASSPSASSPSANIPSANISTNSTNISTNSTSTNTNDNAGTNTNASANSNVNAEASASTNFTNTEAFNNANIAGTVDSINPTTFDFFRTPTPPAISSAPVSPSNEFFDPDALLDTLDTIFGPAAQM